ncbi:MAG: YkgJ family cysteine cluster protein [Myxococcota bacterium]
MASSRLAVIHTARTPLTDEAGKPRTFSPHPPQLRACDLCPGRCCRKYIQTSIPDAVLLCATLGVPFSAILRLAPASPGPRAFAVDKDERYIAAEDGWPGYGELALRQHPDQSCVFLAEFEGHFRCGVYGLRPSVCRLYPLSWTDGERQGGPNSVLCPFPYAVTPSMEARFLDDLEQARLGWARHEALVAEWHARPAEDPRSFDAFLRFVVPRAAAELGVDAGPMLDPRSAADKYAAAVSAGRQTR